MSLDSRLRGNDRTVGPLAIFDDRVEIWSAGGFPKEITTDFLTRRHVSAQRNPIIAGAFHRTGAVECWGRGTNRVIAECERHGGAPPVFEERQGFVVVTFRTPIAGRQPESQPESLAQRVLVALVQRPLRKADIAARLGQKGISGQMNKVIREIVRQGLIEYTIPDKPNSRLQKYRLTEAGGRMLPGATQSIRPRKAQ